VGECGLDEGTALNAFVRGVKVARPASLAAAAAAAGGGGGGTAESVFCIFDDDETGRISFKNLKRVAKELGSKMTDEALQEIIDAGDLDGDGEWSLKEFFDLMILKMTAGASSGWGGGGGGLALREAFHLCGGDVGGVTLASGTAAAEQQKLIDKALGWGKVRTIAYSVLSIIFASLSPPFVSPPLSLSLSRSSHTLFFFSLSLSLSLPLLPFSFPSTFVSFPGKTLRQGLVSTRAV
jgi:hypothetical protein